MKRKTKLMILAIATMLIEAVLQYCVIRFYVNPRFENSDAYYPVIIGVAIVFMLIYSATSTIYGNIISRYD